MEILNGIDQDGVGTGGDCTDIDGATIDDSIIGGTTPAAGSFTTLEASTDPVDADGVGDQGFNDGRYCLESNNLSDVLSAVTSFSNIKQVASDSATGVSELATDAETVTGTATDRVTTPANITAKMAAPGAIGGTTPASIISTTLEATGQLHGALINNQMVQKATFDILGLMTDPRCLYAQMDDPGAGTLYDVSGNTINGTYHGSMVSGDRVSKGMGWSIDPDATNDYIDLGDSDSLSFGNGTNDECVTWFGVIEVVNTGTTKTIISKYDNTAASKVREWKLTIDPDEKLSVNFIDKSVAVVASRITDNTISVGYHVFAVTYDGAGGATAADTIKIYIDGVIVSSTAGNNASYVAMENTTALCFVGASIGSASTVVNFMAGDVALIGIDGSEWSAYDVHRFHQLCKGLYGL